MYQQLKIVRKNLPRPLWTERIESILSGRLESILSDDQALGPKEVFLLEYIQLVAQFRLAIILKKEIHFFSGAISLKEGVGKKLGFSEEDLRRLNVFVRNTYPTRDAYLTESRLRWLINSIEAKVGEKDD